MSGADLSHAVLARANLRESRFRQAILANAYLESADLTQANFYGAEMQRVNLAGAKLKWAHFTQANLREANLLGAALNRTGLDQTTLSGVIVNRADWVAQLPTGAQDSIRGWQFLQDHYMVDSMRSMDHIQYRLRRKKEQATSADSLK